MHYLFLVLYWIIFWQKFLWNPYLLCTSEIASTFFPHWRWMGNQLRQGIFPSQDNIYYKLPGSIPFLATFYPPNLISAWFGSFLKEDHAFKLYAYMIIGHFLLCSIFAYQLFGNLFGAITLAYAGYCIKPNTPTFVFSATWVPLALQGSSIGWAMALFGGYYPILVYILPIVAFLQPISFITGMLIATPQLIPFLGYFKRSIRVKEKVDINFGRVPWWKLADLINPIRNINTTNGVLYPEMMMYMGIAPLIIFSWSYWHISLIIGLLIACGLLPPIQRVSARILYFLIVCISFLLDKTLINHPMLLLQGFLLLRNSSIYPCFPFIQWWDKPSILYHKKPKAYKWPFVTGYREGLKISDYIGAFSLAS